MTRKYCQVTTQVTLRPGWPRISHDETFVATSPASSGRRERRFKAIGAGQSSEEHAECHRVAVSPGGRDARNRAADRCLRYSPHLHPSRSQNRARLPRRAFCRSFQLASVQACARSVIGTGSGENSARLHGCRGRPRTESDRAGLRTCSGGRSRGILATQPFCLDRAHVFSLCSFLGTIRSTRRRREIALLIVAHLGVPLGNAEKEAWRQRHLAAHGGSATASD